MWILFRAFLLLGFACFTTNADPIPQYSMSLREAQGLTLCSYRIAEDVREHRIPKVIEYVKCYSCGKECTHHGKTTATCMELTGNYFVTYSNGITLNESYPVACACITRRAKIGVYDQIEIIDGVSSTDMSVVDNFSRRPLEESCSECRLNRSNLYLSP